MSVRIEFDKPRELRFDLRAIQDLERATGGQPLGQVVTNLSQIGISTLVAALWAGLKHEDKSLTPNLITKMLETYLQSGGRLKPLMDGVSDAIEASGLFKGAEDDEPEGNARPELRSVD